jgi:hypothetical protein
VRWLGSLRITVVLLSFSMALIFFATLDQVNLGIYYVQEKYFKSFFALAPLPFTSRELLPLPGGYTLGVLLLINLVAAYSPRLKFTMKKAGVLMIHAGLILLILGQFFTGLTQQETSMRLDEGQTGNYSESPRFSELAVTDVTDPANETVTVIPAELLRDGETLAPAGLPFRLRVVQFYRNSAIGMKNQVPANLPPMPEVNMGLGVNVAVWETQHTVKENERDMPSAFLDVQSTEGQSLGKWLVSNYIEVLKQQAPIFAAPQQFQHQGRVYQLEMRPRREYKPFQLTLLDFTHDRYPGTEIPKNFSSRVRLIDRGQNEDREVTIYMNNPLRYGGYTFYQHSFANNDTTSVLQVVRNPFWLTPYLACLLVTLGMTLQFGMHLTGFLGRRGRQAARTATAPVSAPDIELGEPAPATKEPASAL